MSEILPENPAIAGLGATMDTPPAPSAPEPEPEVEAGPDLASQFAEMQQVLQQMQQEREAIAPLIDYMQQAPGPDQFGQQQEQQGLRPPNPWDDDFENKMEQYLEARDSQRLAPYESVRQEQQYEHNMEVARDLIADIQAERGELLQPQYGEGQKGLSNTDLILQRAANYEPEMIQQHGQTIRASEAAIEMAYEELKARDAAIIAAAQAQQQNQLASLAGAPKEPGFSGVAAQPQVAAPTSWDDFYQRHGISG